MCSVCRELMALRGAYVNGHKAGDKNQKWCPKVGRAPTTTESNEWRAEYRRIKRKEEKHGTVGQHLQSLIDKVTNAGTNHG